MAKGQLTRGQRWADALSAGMGSWRFLICQTVLLLCWAGVNLWTTWRWDPYPFVFLNLLLSVQAAYSAPAILMSSNRREAQDRARSVKIWRLEQEDHLQLQNLQLHIDRHFHSLNCRVDSLEHKMNK